MTSPTIDYIGTAGEPDTQGLGRLIGQYVNSPKLVALLTGIYDLANDMELMFQKIARFYNIDDDISQDSANTDGASGAQLLGIGRIIGMPNRVPAQDGTSIELTDPQFILLVRARIYRNSVKGGTNPQLLHAIQLIMPDLVTTPLITIEEIGSMTTLIAVGREMADWEIGAFAIPSGISMIRGGLLPRPDGVLLAMYWHDAGCFCFSEEATAGTPIFDDGVGFNTTEESTTGHWAQDF